MKENRICFKCANIYKSETYKELKCPYCGYTITSRRYDLILNNAKNAVQFGYNYRMKYEIDYNIDKKIEKHYYLVPLDQVMSFIGVAISSGIVGNIAYDVVKKVIYSIIEKIHSNKYKDNRISMIVDDEEKLKVFIKYVQAFYNDFENLNPEIKEAIYEEMIVDKSMEKMQDIIKAMHPKLAVEVKKCNLNFSREKFFKCMLEAKKELKVESQKKNRIKSYFYTGFWDNMKK